MQTPTSTPNSGQVDPLVQQAQQNAETTKLSPLEEALFAAWTKANGIKDADKPESFYDYKGFFKATNGKNHPPGAIEHFPDTFKQHGHPTFSVESKYSKGPHDGGMWAGDKYIPQPPMAVDHPQGTNPAQNTSGSPLQDTLMKAPQSTQPTAQDPIQTLFGLMKQR